MVTETQMFSNTSFDECMSENSGHKNPKVLQTSIGVMTRGCSLCNSGSRNFIETINILGFYTKIKCSLDEI